MKLDQLRKVIREEVKSAIKEELQDMLNEAVKAASTPNSTALTSTNDGYKPVTQKDISKTWSTGKISTGTIPLEEMITQTSKEMTNEDYKTIINATSPQAPSFASRAASNLGSGGTGAGLDLSSIPGFDPSKAKAILNAAEKKSKARAGL
jgi:hypothetical protein